MDRKLTTLEALKALKTARSFRLSYENNDWLDKEEQDKLFDIIETVLKKLEDLMEKYDIEDLEALDDMLLENYLNIKIPIGEIKCQK